MTTQSGSTPASPYTPPPEMLEAAEKMLASATPAELALADKLYVAYGSVTGQRSAISGAELPTFDICRPLVRAGWLASVREAHALLQRPAGAPMRMGEFSIAVDCSEAEAAMAGLESRADTFVNKLERGVELVAKLEQANVAGDESGRIDPFLLGISEIASATRALAEAAQSIDGTDAATNPVRQIIAEVAEALRHRVSALASPPTEPTANA